MEDTAGEAIVQHRRALDPSCLIDCATRLELYQWLERFNRICARCSCLSVLSPLWDVAEVCDLTRIFSRCEILPYNSGNVPIEAISGRQLLDGVVPGGWRERRLLLLGKPLDQVIRRACLFGRADLRERALTRMLSAH